MLGRTKNLVDGPLLGRPRGGRNLDSLFLLQGSGGLRPKNNRGNEYRQDNFTHKLRLDVISVVFAKSLDQRQRAVTPAGNSRRRRSGPHAARGYQIKPWRSVLSRARVECALGPLGPCAIAWKECAPPLRDGARIACGDSQPVGSRSIGKGISDSGRQPGALAQEANRGE
jgi:hypothetical protein